MMKTLFLYLALTVTAVSFFAQEKTIDVNKAKISFVFVSKEVNGTLGDLQSTSYIALNNPENSVFEGSVSLESLKTGNFLRDWHLMNRKYFYRKRFPRISFKSTSVLKKENDYEIKGMLSMKGISKPITLSLKVSPTKLYLTGLIYTSDWDINIMDNKVDNEVSFEIELPFQ
jgi:polyisoprenoid-binding protein YceI